MSPLYAYRCGVCGRETSTLERGDRAPCQHCGANATRNFRFRTQTAFQPHFNHTVRAPVNNQRDFNDKLKRASEEATLKTGLEHDFQPVDLADKEAFGITAEHEAHLEETRHVRELANGPLPA